jgi:hypothetical protein
MKLQDRNMASSPHLSQQQIELLLAQGETSSEASTLADHLSRCELCQSRLTESAAGNDEWSDAQTYLSGEDEPRWEPDLSQAGLSHSTSQAVSESLHEQVLRMVEAPHHPEMLGRLGRYEIERVIGSGGMGIVLKAHDSELNRPIAIKLLAPDMCHNGAARERFAREGRAAAAVVHEHVVAIYNVESGGSVPFLVMQYVPGRSLEARVTEDGPLAVEEILRIGAQAAEGLAAAHRQGLVHRDVKPANILLENSVERAILTDFGLARAIDDASLTRTGILAGTPHYMSPEQAQGNAVDHRSDLFSLGAVLYFMATGHPPFRGSTAMGVLHRICRDAHRPVWQVNKDIPDELADVIDRLLEKKPAQRFATAEEVQERLESLLSKAQRDGLGRRRFQAWRRMPRRRRAMWLAGALVAIVAIGTGVWKFVTPPPAVGGTTVLAATYERARALSDVRQDSTLDAEITSDLGAVLQSLPALQSNPRYLQDSQGTWWQELGETVRQLEQVEAINGQSINRL